MALRCPYCSSVTEAAEGFSSWPEMKDIADLAGLTEHIEGLHPQEWKKLGNEKHAKLPFLAEC